MITAPYPYIDGGLAKLTLKLGNVWLYALVLSQCNYIDYFTKLLIMGMFT